jgi:hypothetical protein
MSNGLDQYLANRLAAAGVFQVVTDPKKADAIFTDKLGEGFEARLNDLLPPPAEKKDSSKSSDESDRRPVTSSFGRGKGTIFLVEISSRAVLWSAYELPRNSTPREMDRIAQRIVERLKGPSNQK